LTFRREELPLPSVLHSGLQLGDIPLEKCVRH